MIRLDSLSEQWPKVRLGDVVEFLDHKRKPITAKNRVAGPYPYYGANGQQDSVEGYIFDESLILLAEDGGNFGNPDRTIAYQVEGKCWVNNHAHVLRPTSKIDIRYLCRHLEKYDVSPYINGATRQKLNKSASLEIILSLPPMEEQKRIAAILDKADAIRRKRQQAIDLTDQLLRSVFLDMFGDPVTNPKGWEVKPLESACVEKSGVKAGPFGSALKKEFYTESGYRIYGQEQVIAGTLSIGDYYIDEAKYSKLASCSVESGDMLVSLVGTLGKTLVVPEKFEPGIINPRLVRLRTNKKLLNSEYLQQLFKQPGFQAQLAAYSHGGTMPILNAGIIKGLNVQLPPIELQLRFILILKSIERKMSNFLSAQALNEDLFSSLTQRAFKGELTKQTKAA